MDIEEAKARFLSIRNNLTAAIQVAHIGVEFNDPQNIPELSFAVTKFETEISKAQDEISNLLFKLNDQWLEDHEKEGFLK